MAECAQCGAVLVGDQRYCVECGARRPEMPGGAEARPGPELAARGETSEATTAPLGYRWSPLATILFLALLGGMLVAGVLIGKDVTEDEPTTVTAPAQTQTAVPTVATIPTTPPLTPPAGAPTNPTPTAPAAPVIPPQN